MAAEEITDAELEIAILGGLRSMREGLQQGSWNRSTMTTAQIAVMVDEPKGRVAALVSALAEEGLIKESKAAPARWMLADKPK